MARCNINGLRSFIRNSNSYYQECISGIKMVKPTLSEISSDNELYALPYNKMKQYFETNYQVAYDLAIKVYQQMISLNDKILSKFQIVMEGETVLDSKLIPELESKIRYAEMQIQRLERQIYEDSWYFGGGVDSYARFQIQELRRLIAECRRKINQIQRMVQVDNECAQLYRSETRSAIEAFSNLVESISEWKGQRAEPLSTDTILQNNEGRKNVWELLSTSELKSIQNVYFGGKSLSSLNYYDKSNITSISSNAFYNDRISMINFALEYVPVYNEKKKTWEIWRSSDLRDEFKGKTLAGAGFDGAAWCAKFLTLVVSQASPELNELINSKKFNKSYTVSWIDAFKSGGFVNDDGEKVNVDGMKFVHSPYFNELSTKKNKNTQYNFEFEPQVGDVAFLDLSGSSKRRGAYKKGLNTNSIDHVGIIADIIRDENGKITQIVTIEGNTHRRAISNKPNYVMADIYDVNDPKFMGYGTYG